MHPSAIAPVMKDAVARRATAYVEMIRDLVRASADGDAAAADRSAAIMAAAGGSVCEVRQSFEVTAARSPQPEPVGHPTHEAACANVVGTWKGTGSGRSMILFAHHDSPAPSGLDRWTYPAFEPQIADGRLYGWGAADDKSGVAAMVAAVDVLREAGLSLVGDVTLVSCVSKNRARGMAVVLANGLRADGCVYLHPAETRRGLQEVKNLTPGLLEFRVTVGGRAPATSEPQHTPFAHQGENAVVKMTRILSALQALDAVRGERVGEPSLQQALGRSTNLLIGTISGGEGARRVPVSCRMDCSATFPASETIESVRAEIQGAVDAVAAGDPWLREHPPVMDWLEGTQPAGIPVEHPLFQTVSRAITAVTGRPPEPYCAHSASDIRIPMLYAGIPAVGYGPRCTAIAAAGAADESIEIAEFLNTVTATALLLATWCGVKGQ
jgi:acetylornithine deacetylase